jgi:hypothetical protein
MERIGSAALIPSLLPRSGRRAIRRALAIDYMLAETSTSSCMQCSALGAT